MGTTKHTCSYSLSGFLGGQLLYNGSPWEDSLAFSAKAAMVVMWPEVVSEAVSSCAIDAAVWHRASKLVSRAFLRWDTCT